MDFTAAYGPNRREISRARLRGDRLDSTSPAQIELSVLPHPLFDVASTTTGAADEFANVSSTAIGQFFPIFELPFVCAREDIDGQIVTTDRRCGNVMKFAIARARSPGRRCDRSSDLIAADTPKAFASRQPWPQKTRAKGLERDASFQYHRGVWRKFLTSAVGP